MDSKKIVMTGSLPPPIGGVTVFIKYFIEACAKSSVPVEFFKWKKILLFKYKNDLLYINSSNNLKRFLFVLLGRLFFSKVFFVKHGGLFDVNDFFVKASFKLSDGVLCLNENVRNQLNRIGVTNFSHTTIFIENIGSGNVIKTKNAREKLLFYCNNSTTIDGCSTYGVDFILSCMAELETSFDLIVVDLSKQYEDDFSNYPNVTYHSNPVDFKELLMEVDIYIRPTRTDGMSVAILEAGLLGVKCLASDVVARPDFVVVYKLDSKIDFINKLNHLRQAELKAEVKLNSITDVVSFMRNV